MARSYHRLSIARGAPSLLIDIDGYGSIAYGFVPLGSRHEEATPDTGCPTLVLPNTPTSGQITH